MGKPYLPMYIADYVIEYCNDNGIEINNLKLQKIMYYLQAKFLVDLNEPLFDENLQKWKYGPVVPSVYHEYKDNGASNITKDSIATIFRNPIGNERPNAFGMFVSEVYSKELILEEDRNNIDSVIKSLGSFTGFELVDKTHNHKIWYKDKDMIEQGIQGIEYSRSEIENYFRENDEACLWR